MRYQHASHFFNSLSPWYLHHCICALTTPSLLVALDTPNELNPFCVAPTTSSTWIPQIVPIAPKAPLRSTLFLQIPPRLWTYAQFHSLSNTALCVVHCTCTSRPSLYLAKQCTSPPCPMKRFTYRCLASFLHKLALFYHIGPMLERVGHDIFQGPSFESWSCWSRQVRQGI